ncbi:glycosyltransferase [Sulfoacidibacillus thermotolerans]|uniref:Glycosyl transferase family 1 domain-containing protein n=1 Tax=Sulfoacidibacillus thermotolerans TaxID=1765684 RepID=A0A2U3D7N7_SULT2|nr:glycosyltransferase [Sulfoacidibacillus thermotolerans]PWI57283.1 hypothetical protein BM613_09300 [Sulfoacidibacillus thermotolerans]
MTSIYWEGPMYSSGSLAHVNRELCARLGMHSAIELGIIPDSPDHPEMFKEKNFNQLTSFYYRNLSKVDYHIRQQWPPNFSAPRQGKWVLFQPWEFGYIPKTWVFHALYQIDEIWVNSQYTKKMYTDSGIPDEKIFSFPLGIDTNLYTPSGEHLQLKTEKKFKFLFVGGTIWRKGIDILLQAYINRFTKNDDVCLIIKDYGVHSFYQGQTSQETIQKIQMTPNTPEIIYIKDELSPQQMAALYRTCDVLVHPYRGEGFGLPILEAMSCGIPVIIPDQGPAVEFTNKNCALFVPSKIQTGTEQTDLVSNLKWIEVQPEVLSETLSLALKYQNTLHEMGRNAAQLAHSQFTWEQSADHILKHLESADYSDIPTRFQPKAWYSIGQHHFFNQQWDAAEAAFAKAIEIDAHDVRSAIAHASCLIEIGQLGRAVTELLTLRKQFVPAPYHQEILLLLAKSMTKLQRLQEAKEYCIEALTRSNNEEISLLLREIDSKLADQKKLISSEVHTLVHTNHSQQWIDSRIEKLNRQFLGVYQKGERVLYLNREGLPANHKVISSEVEYHVFNLPNSALDELNNGSISAFLSLIRELFHQFQYQGIIMDKFIETLPVKLASQIFSAIKELAAPNFRLIITYSNVSTLELFGEFWDKESNVRPYTEALLNKLLLHAGFKIKEMSERNREKKENYIIASQYAIPTLWEAPVLNTSGYATGNQKLLEALRAYPLSIQLNLRENDSKPEVYDADFVQYIKALQSNKIIQPIIHYQNVPAYGFVPPNAVISIGRTMFETDRIPEDWVWKCNQLSEIWVPSTFNVETFAKSGVDEKRIKVIPEPFDFDFFTPSKLPLDKKALLPGIKSFIFFSNFTWLYRKGWDVLIRAYVEEFSKYDDVTLLIKTSKMQMNESPENELNKFLKSLGYTRESAPHIAMIDGNLTEEQIRLLYNLSDAFVLPTRGEGWGRPFMEAMAMELPVIGTNWGGNTSFMNKSNSYLIEIEGLEEIGPEMSINFYQGHYWANPSITSTRSAMREVYSNYNTAKNVAINAREDLKNRFDSHSVTRLIVDRIQELVNSYYA